jgi:hypothetical protein
MCLYLDNMPLKTHFHPHFQHRVQFAVIYDGSAGGGGFKEAPI